MAVKCKFKCVEVGEREGWSKEHPRFYVVKMSPVTGGSGENDKFWEATPNGTFEFSNIISKFDFEVGREYYVTIDMAPKKE